MRLGHLDPSGGTFDQAFGPTDEPLDFVRVDFDHPLWILYSSGTTGTPKAIVHGHGSVLLEHLKMWRLQLDVRPGDRVLWFTTTGWMMWNLVTSALLAGACVVCVDGSPGHPDMNRLWEIAERFRVTLLGAGAAYIHACVKARLHPARGRDLSSLRAVGATGSPLSSDGFRWVYQELPQQPWLVSISGGTDIVSAFLGACPVEPVYQGELGSPALGVDAQAWNDGGGRVLDEVGELVITQPMPSMPVSFWGDPGGERYREAYFATYRSVWRHGDWIRFTLRGTSVITGRSDATINRDGIRTGTPRSTRRARPLRDRRRDGGRGARARRPVREPSVPVLRSLAGGHPRPGGSWLVSGGACEPTARPATSPTRSPASRRCRAP